MEHKIQHVNESILEVEAETQAAELKDSDQFIDPMIYSEEKELVANNSAAQSDWTTVFSNKNIIDAFSDDDYYDCVEVTPEDIQNLINQLDTVGLDVEKLIKNIKNIKNK